MSRALCVIRRKVKNNNDKTEHTQNVNCVYFCSNTNTWTHVSSNNLLWERNCSFVGLMPECAACVSKLSLRQLTACSSLISTFTHRAVLKIRERDHCINRSRSTDFSKMDNQGKREVQQRMSDSSDDDFIAVVIDNGSMICKGGFNGGKTCRAVVRSIVGKPLPEKTESTEEPARNIYIGEDALRERDSLTLSYPMERGCVQSWEDMEEVWKAAYHKELSTKPEEHALLITEAPHNPSSHRERMAEVLFESLDIPGSYVVYPGILALYASGRTTGIVIDSGDTVTSAIPIYEGEVQHQAIRRIDLGGRDLTKHFQNLLHRRGLDFSSSGGFEIVRELKEKHSFVAQNFEKEFRERTPLERKVELQDGTAITLEEEMFSCPEVLFNPSLAGMGCKGIAELVYDAVTSCGTEMRENLYQNVIMSGANFMVRGVAEQLKHELTSLAPANTDIRVVCPPERNKSAWLGGSILACLSFFPGLVVGRAEYSEVGPSVLHRCRLNSMLPDKT